jgi:3-polyprenyl-4-hydroxybenzoate decarboxylase
VSPRRPRLVVGVSGSSGPQLGYALLRALHDLGTVETHLVISRGALAFYHRPPAIDDLVDQIAGRILDQFGIAHSLSARWSGAPRSATPMTPGPGPG